MVENFLLVEGYIVIFNVLKLIVWQLIQLENGQLKGLLLVHG